MSARAAVSACALVAFQVEWAQAHTVSIGYESTGPGAVTFWFGTYHTGVNYTEGSLKLVGSGFAETVAFTLLTSTKPAGLIDGTTNFYSNGTALVGSFSLSAYQGSGLPQYWQGAAFTGLKSGTYTFTYIPIASPTSVWQPEDNAILSYTVDLSGVVQAGTQLSPFAGNGNQRAVAGVLDTALAGGASNSGLTALGSMSAQGISNGLTQAGGESAAGAPQAAMQSLNPFLTLMVDPFVASRGNGFGPALGYAPERQLSPAVANAYAAVTPKSESAVDPAARWSAWGNAFGGQYRANGDANVGSHDTSASAVGVAVGVDYRVAPTTVLGFAFSGGHNTWGLSEGLGGGQGDVFQAGVYGSTREGDAYLSGSLAVGINKMSTSRDVTISGLDRLVGSFDALSYGGRVETGYRIATDVVAVTPYAAVQAQAFHLPSYNETASLGTNNFALTYNSQTSTDTRTEVGTWLDRSFATPDDGVVVLRGRVAWAHDWASGQGVSAVFQSFTAPGFVVQGAATPSDSVLTSAGAELRLASGLTFGVKLDGNWVSRAQTYGGTGTLRYTW
jgi:uncharacterized protein with beta-barrel porin domain